MKNLLVGLLTLGCISAFASTQSIKIDRALYGDNVFGYVEGQTYKFNCEQGILAEKKDLFAKSTKYSLDQQECKQALLQANQFVRNGGSAEFTEILLDCAEESCHLIP